MTTYQAKTKRHPLPFDAAAVDWNREGRLGVKEEEEDLGRGYGSEMRP